MVMISKILLILEIVNVKLSYFYNSRIAIIS